MLRHCASRPRPAPQQHSTGREAAAPQSRPTLPHPPRPASSCRPAQAFSNVLRRMLEAAGRGMWKADASTLQQLQEMYADLDTELEGITR